MTIDGRVLRTFLITFFAVFITTILLGQDFKSVYNPFFVSEKIQVTDTIIWNYTDTLQQELIDYFPINSNIILSYDRDTISLNSTSVKVIGDTTYLTISRMSYSLQIDIVIKIADNLICNGQIYYWTAFNDSFSDLKIDNCKLELNKNTFIKGDEIMGKIDLFFTGIIPNEKIYKDNSENNNNNFEKSGLISGFINVVIE
jgi:hypothetical protein